MKKRIFVRATASIILASVVGILPAYGGVIVTATEIGGNVVFSGSGTLNIVFEELEYQNLPAVGGELRAAPPPSSPFGFEPAAIVIGDGNYDSSSIEPDDGSPSIGPGNGLFQATSESGDVIGIVFSNPYILVPTGYESGDPLSGSAIFAGESFASLGIMPGTYMWTWFTTTGKDSYTLQVVPEPSTLAIASLGVMLLAMVRWRQRNKG